MNQTRRILLLLATFAGMCGISYELLYSRILSSYFGDVYYITAAILIGFLTSLGIGALVAHRFVRYLPHIEIGIGLYALFATYIFNNEIIELVRFAHELGGVHEPVTLTLFVIILLAVPAFLIGFSVPIFSLYLQKDTTHTFFGFRHVYLFYNIGAAIAILLIEFVLLRQFGITATLLTVASVNLVVGTALIFVRPATQTALNSLEQKAKGWSRAYTRLFLASVASGVFQLFFLELTYRIFGPFNENFAIVLATVFLGLALGTHVVVRFKITLGSLALMLVGVLALNALFVTPLTYATAYLAPLLGTQYALLLKIVLIVCFGIAAFTCFGGMVPAFLQSKKGYHSLAGRALATSAFGNVLGFLLAVFVLHYHFDTPHMLTSVIAALALSVCIPVRTSQAIGVSKIIVLVISFGVLSVAFALWPHALLRVGYDQLTSIEHINAITHEVIGSKDFRHFGDYVSVLDLKDGRRRLVFNGYFSLDLAEHSSPVAFREALVGMASAHFNTERERALVLGLGTGITAGAAAELYREVDVIDINPAMIDVAKEFRSYNFNFPEKENVTVNIQDGIVALISATSTYDAIINTVASPLYFSASKLWTSEALTLAKERLSHDGVYVSWLDARVGIDGIRTQLRTLYEVFPECQFILLNTQYYVIVCGEVLEVVSDVGSVWSDEIIDVVYKYSGTSSVSQLLDDLDVTPRGVEHKAMLEELSSVAPNTMDASILEYQGQAAIRDTDKTQEFFTWFAVLPDNMSEAERARRCRNLNLVIENQTNLLLQFKGCADIFQTTEAGMEMR